MSGRVVGVAARDAGAYVLVVAGWCMMADDGRRGQKLDAWETGDLRDFRNRSKRFNLSGSMLPEARRVYFPLMRIAVVLAMYGTEKVKLEGDLPIAINLRRTYLTLYSILVVPFLRVGGIRYRRLQVKGTCTLHHRGVVPPPILNLLVLVGSVAADPDENW